MQDVMNLFKCKYKVGEEAMGWLNKNTIDGLLDVAITRLVYGPS